MKSKYLLSALFVFCLGNSLFSQSHKISSGEIPNEVFNNFSKDFPSVKNVSWEKRKGHIYHADFTENNRKISVYYDWLGILLLKEEILSAEELPANVSSYLLQSYNFSNPQNIRKDEQGYRVTVDKTDILKFDVLFDNDGNFVKEILECAH